MKGASKKAIWGILFCYLILGFYFGSWRTEKIVKNDVIIYYEYLTAAFMFNDLSFEFAFDLPDDFDGDIWLEKGLEGEHFPKMTMGVALMLTPFYLIPYVTNQIFDLGSYGYSSFFQFFVFVAAMVYAALSLIILRKVLLKFFEEKVVVWTIMGVFLATNLAYYVCVEPGMSHIYSFFLFSALIYVTINWHEKPGFRNSGWLGLILGLIFLVRPTNVVIAFLPVLYGIWNLDSLKQKGILIKDHLSKISVVLIVGLALCSIQFIFWKYSTGNWLIYGYTDEGFFWSDPKFAKGLFSFRKGFLVYTPIMALALAGLFIPQKSELRRVRVAAVVFVITNFYIVFSWWCWWYGGSLGQRALVESYSLLSIFLGLFIYYSFLKSPGFFKPVLQLIIVGCVCLNVFQMKQYSTSLLHWDSMNFETYKAIFGKTKFPENYSDLIDPPDYDSAMKGDR